MPRITAHPSSFLLRALGTALVAATFLLPRALQAEEVSDEERKGEWDGDGERFGSIVVHGELVASPTAPGGVTLVRTYENTGDEKERFVVEERLMRAEASMQARVGPTFEPLLVRTQVLELGPHQKKSIGTFLPASIADKVGKELRRAQAIEASLAAGTYNTELGMPAYPSYSVDYLRPLAKGEVAAKSLRFDMMPRAPMRPVDVDGDAPAEVAKIPTLKPTTRTLRGNDGF